MKSRAGKVRFYTVPKGRLAPCVPDLLTDEICLEADSRILAEIEDSKPVSPSTEPQAFWIGGIMDRTLVVLGAPAGPTGRALLFSEISLGSVYDLRLVTVRDKTPAKPLFTLLGVPANGLTLMLPPARATVNVYLDDGSCLTPHQAELPALLPKSGHRQAPTGDTHCSLPGRDFDPDIGDGRAPRKPQAPVPFPDCPGRHPGEWVDRLARSTLGRRSFQ